jgi:hypothetical protein
MLLVVVPLVAILVWAQTIHKETVVWDFVNGLKSRGVWVATVEGSPGEPGMGGEACQARNVWINLAGGGADIVVGASPIAILGSNDTRCQAIIRNKGGASMRCLPTNQGTPSASVGQEFSAGEFLLMGTSSRPGWQCIRTTGANTLVTIVEETP